MREKPGKWTSKSDMMKSMLSLKPKAVVEKEKADLALELSEIEEISEIIFKKIEKKIQVFEAIEATVDKKIALLERLVQRSEAFSSPGSGTNRHREIVALTERGLKTAEIADILDMPLGEVNLILELHVQKT